MLEALVVCCQRKGFVGAYRERTLQELELFSVSSPGQAQLYENVCTHQHYVPNINVPIHIYTYTNMPLVFSSVRRLLYAYFLLINLVNIEDHIF